MNTIREAYSNVDNFPVNLNVPNEEKSEGKMGERLNGFVICFLCKFSSF